jgi:hypothetical protein
MDIHFISSLGLMPIAYTIRIKTASNTVYQHTRTELEPPDAADDYEAAETSGG